MISQERFDEIELEYGCGYWNVCWEHACPCAITVENKGLQESIYNSLLEESREVAREYDEEDFDYDFKSFEDEEELYDDIEDDEFDCDSVEGGCGCCPFDEPICAKYLESQEE